MFITVNAAQVAKQEAGGQGISTSGIYPVTIKGVEVTPTTNGGTQLNYYFDKRVCSFNLVVDTKGQPTFGMDVLQGLCVVAGLEGLQDPSAISIPLKDSVKETIGFPELEGVEVKVWLQFEYSRYNGEVKEKITVKRFYRASDDASGTEILSGENIGQRMAKDLAYSTTVKYSDGITAEDVATWKAGTSASAPKAPAAVKPAANVFGVAK